MIAIVQERDDFVWTIVKDVKWHQIAEYVKGIAVKIVLCFDYRCEKKGESLMSSPFFILLSKRVMVKFVCI